MQRKVISIVAENRGVGRTTIAVNLAFALASMGRKTLLVSPGQRPIAKKVMPALDFFKGKYAGRAMAGKQSKNYEFIIIDQQALERVKNVGSGFSALIVTSPRTIVSEDGPRLKEMFVRQNIKYSVVVNDVRAMHDEFLRRLVVGGYDGDLLMAIPHLEEMKKLDGKPVYQTNEESIFSARMLDLAKFYVSGQRPVFDINEWHITFERIRRFLGI